jgi:hypothetical protein
VRSWVGSDLILERTIVGPGISAQGYATVAVVTLIGLALFAWYQTASLLVHGPQIFGAIAALVTFFLLLEGKAPAVRRALFERYDVENVQSPTGEDQPGVRYREASPKQVTSDDDGVLRVISHTPRAFLARLFTDPPTLDVSDIETVEDVRGVADEAYIADPMADAPVRHVPPGLTWHLPILSRMDGRVRGWRRTAELSLRGLASAALVAAPLWIGWTAAEQALNAPLVGVAAAGLVLVPVHLTATDAWVDFDSAPFHYQDARAAARVERRELDNARTLQAFRNLAREEQMRTALDAIEIERERDATMLSEMIEDELGISIDDPMPERPGRERPERGDVDPGQNGHDDDELPDEWTTKAEKAPVNAHTDGDGGDTDGE